VLHQRSWCYTRPVPTTRPRLTLTETDELAEALELAAKRWPEVRSRRELLLRLVEEGRDAVAQHHAGESQARREAIKRTSGSLTGSFERGYLERLRHDWPA
jgi:hypothetical protein